MGDAWGYQKGKREPVSVIPEDIRATFNELDIDKVWIILESKFRVNLAYHKPRFEQHFRRQPHELTRMEIFYRYMKAEFDDRLCFIRGQKDTFEKIVRHVVQQKINEMRKHHDWMMKQYGRSSYSDYFKKN